MSAADAALMRTVARSRLRGLRRRRRRPEPDGAPAACRVCGRPLEHGRLYDVRGSHGRCAIALHCVPCRICPTRGHPRRWPRPEFGAALAEAIFAGEGVPIAHAPRFGRPRCHACGRRLEGEDRERGSVSGEVLLHGDAFTVEIAAPIVECARCGAVQARADRSVVAELSEALRRAVERSRLEP